MRPTLRPYQSELVAGIRNEWGAGNRNTLAVMATGGGKSVVLSDIVADEQELSCTIAHRQELVSQLSGHLANSGVKHRLIAPVNVAKRIAAEHRKAYGRSFVDPDARAAVAGVDTLVSPSRQAYLSRWAQQVGLWVIDEAAHVLAANKWGTAATMFPNARGLGVTATPLRADGRGLGRHASGVFDTMVLGCDSRALIGMGNLTDYEIVLPASDLDVSGVALTGSGDYSPKGLRNAVERSHIVGDVVENYAKWAFGSRAVVFATDVATAEGMAAAFQAAGINAACVSGVTPGGERAKSVRDFREGAVSVLVSVDIFDEGFDLPAIETVIMARPTWSLGKYLQQIGRGLRPMPGKERALIIDHVSNVKRHGLPDAPRRWSLDDRERGTKGKRDPDVIPVTHCSQCMHAYERIHKACPHCGHEPELAGRSLPEQVDGDLTLLDREALEKLRAATELETPESIGARAAMSAGGEAAGRGASARQRERIEAQRKLADAIALWAGDQRAQGRSDSESYRRFYFKHGTSVAEALGMSRADMERLTGELNGA